MNNSPNQQNDAAFFILNLVAQRDPKLILYAFVLLVNLTHEQNPFPRFVTLMNNRELANFRRTFTRIQNGEHVVGDLVIRQIESLAKTPEINSFMTDELPPEELNDWLFDEPYIKEIIHNNYEEIIDKLLEPHPVSKGFTNALRTQMANARASLQQNVDLSTLPPVTSNSAYKVRIFVSSTSEVVEETEHIEAIAHEFNMPYGGIASRMGLIIELVSWQLAAPSGGLAQHGIDLQLRDIDVIIGILWKRFGTPSGMRDRGWKADSSGTEWELRTAYRNWLRTGSPRIMMYRSTRTPENIDEIDLAQLAKVKEFMLNFHSGGEMPSLYTLYKTPDDFKERLRRDLAQILPYIAFQRHT